MNTKYGHRHTQTDRQTDRPDRQTRQTRQTDQTDRHTDTSHLSNILS